MGMTRRFCRQILAVAGILFAAPAQADRDKPDIDVYAVMKGKCSTLKIGGRDFACRAVAYFHSESGRAKFTVVVDDPADRTHIIAFSGEYGHRTQDDLYVLAVDRIELKSKDRPKVDGLPVPAVEVSNGMCRQVGYFARLEVSTISCSATDQNGLLYQLQFVSDGSPINVRRVHVTAPTIRRDPYQ
jgi:hypothetical protein